MWIAKSEVILMELVDACRNARFYPCGINFVIYVPIAVFSVEIIRVAVRPLVYGVVGHGPRLPFGCLTCRSFGIVVQPREVRVA